jgi:hypothetical protein
MSPYDNTPADAHEYLKALGIPKDDLRWQTMMFWRGIITLSELEAAGVTDWQAAIAALDADITTWLLA